jgi:hypothetical protein
MMPVADAPILIFDVNLLLTTQSHWIFLNQLKIHPGAVAVWNNFITDPQICEHDDHRRQAFQLSMLRTFGPAGGKNVTADFFNRCLEFGDRIPTDEEIHRVIRQMNRDRQA